MAKAQTTKKRGGLRKHGRNKDKCAAYKNLKTREKNKLKRVLRSNGREAAKSYAEKYQLTEYLKRISR
jgi:hypothetical protein